jgi:hypothetical protein
MATRCRWPPDSSSGRCFRNGELDVLEDVQDRDEVEGLEDEADAPVAQVGEVVEVPVADGLPVEGVGPGGGPVEAADDVEERRLPGAARPHHHRELAGLDVEVHAAERRHDGPAEQVVLRDAAQGDEGQGGLPCGQ